VAALPETWAVGGRPKRLRAARVRRGGPGQVVEAVRGDGGGVSAVCTTVSRRGHHFGGPEDEERSDDENTDQILFIYSQNRSQAELPHY